MNRFKKLRLMLTGLLVLMTLTAGTSAFADSRHRNETRFRNDRGRYFQHRGRISHFNRHRGGYYVYVGAPYPFYVPQRYWHRDRFRVGFYVDLGGYYNSRGYYDYHGDRYRGRYNDRYDDRYGEKKFIEATLTGVVESVDERRARFILKNDATGSLITVSMLAAAGRTDVRPGDHLQIDGEWTRLGVFDAVEIDFWSAEAEPPL